MQGRTSSHVNEKKLNAYYLDRLGALNDLMKFKLVKK